MTWKVDCKTEKMCNLIQEHLFELGYEYRGRGKKAYNGVRYLLMYEDRTLDAYDATVAGGSGFKSCGCPLWTIEQVMELPPEVTAHEFTIGCKTFKYTEGECDVVDIDMDHSYNITHLQKFFDKLKELGVVR